MIGRLIFASLVTAVFLTSILVGLAGGYTVVLVLALAGIVILALGRGDITAREARARRIRPYLGFFLHTNNRWLLCLLAMTVVSFVVAIKTEPGAPVVKTYVANKVEKGGHSQRLEEIRERHLNLYHSGQYKTNAELRRQEPEPGLLKKWLDRLIPKQRSWTPWLLRWGCSFLLLLLTMGYFPFTFSDEVRTAYHAAERHFAERAVGEAGVESPLWGFLGRLLRIPPGQPRGSPTTPPAQPATGGTPPTAGAGAVAAHAARAFGRGGLWSIFLVALAAELFGERLFERRTI